MKYADPDQFTGITFESGRFFILFEHPTRQGGAIAKKRVLLRPEDVSALRKAIDAYEIILGALTGDEMLSGSRAMPDAADSPRDSSRSSGPPSAGP